MPIKAHALQLDTRAIEIATRADARVQSVEKGIERLDAQLGQMRAENSAQHAASAAKLDQGLGRMHDRLDEHGKAMNRVVLGVAGTLVALLAGWLWDVVRGALT